MTLYLSNNDPLHLPEEECQRFETQYQEWLKSGHPCGEFLYDKGHMTHFIRYDAIVRREARCAAAGTARPSEQ